MHANAPGRCYTAAGGGYSRDKVAAGDAPARGQLAQMKFSATLRPNAIKPRTTPYRAETARERDAEGASSRSPPKPCLRGFFLFFGRARCCVNAHAKSNCSREGKAFLRCPCEARGMVNFVELVSDRIKKNRVLGIRWLIGESLEKVCPLILSRNCWIWSGACSEIMIGVWTAAVTWKWNEIFSIFQQYLVINYLLGSTRHETNGASCEKRKNNQFPGVTIT